MIIINKVYKIKVIRNLIRMNLQNNTLRIHKYQKILNNNSNNKMMMWKMSMFKNFKMEWKSKEMVMNLEIILWKN